MLSPSRGTYGSTRLLLVLLPLMLLVREFLWGVKFQLGLLWRG